MQTRSRIVDDLARVASGAVSTLAGVKGEIEALVRHRVERLLADIDAVPRDEFEAVKAMAATARAEQERLEQRVAILEAQLKGSKGAASGSARRSSPTPSAQSRKKTSTPTPKRRPKTVTKPSKSKP